MPLAALVRSPAEPRRSRSGIRIAMPVNIVLVSLCASGCALPPAPAYSCAERAREVAAFLATDPALPTVTRLPSGERIYISDAPPHAPVHYDGPLCQ